MPSLLSLVSSGVRHSRESRLFQSSLTDERYNNYSPVGLAAGPLSGQASNGVNTGLNNQADYYNRQNNQATTAYELDGSEVTTPSEARPDNENNTNNSAVDENHNSASSAAPPRLESTSPTPVGPQHLPYPVIIPQRRPEAKERGFLYAYATVLNDCGIDEETFLGFLRTLNQACKTSKIFDAVNYGGLAASAVPNINAQFYGIAASLAAKSSKWMQSGQKVNQYLYQMNEELFKPHGLFCLIMTYNPPEAAAAAAQRGSKRASMFINSTKSSMKTRVQSLLGPMEMSSGVLSEPALPEHAPLVFPENVPKSKLGRFTDARYMDEQAQLEYIQRARDLGLDQASSQLASLYPIENDIPPSQQRQSRYLQNTRQSLMGSRQSGLKAITSSIRDSFNKQEMLYLMVVNLPTQEEYASTPSREAARMDG